MEIKQTRALRGPNLWSRYTALEIEVACSDEECEIDQLNGFVDKLRAICPGVADLRAPGYHGPLTMAHVLEATLLALQANAGCPLSFSLTNATPVPQLYQVVVEYSEEDVGRLALTYAMQVSQYVFVLCRGQLADDAPAPDVTAMVAELREMDEDNRLGPSTGSIVNAAVARGVPFRRLTSGSLVQLGWGCKQRRIQAAEVDSTSAVAETIAQDKNLTKHLLHAAGVPVPHGAPVKTAEQAWEVALRIGLPVVCKPQNGSQGKGVTVNITLREQMDKAFDAATIAARGKGPVLVEKFFPGSDYRLLVVGNKLVAAARRDPPQVIGDGKHSVRELVNILNADPRRSEGHATSLTKISFDDIAVACLAEQQMSPESIPEVGRRVVLRNNANLSTGGSATDVTDDVHPEVAARAIDAAAMVGLHVCGVDVVVENIMRPLEEQNGGVVEVNAAPGLRMHLTPSYGKGRNIGEAVIQQMFRQGDDARIPVVAVTGVNGKTTTTRLIAHVLANKGLCVGMTNTDGVYVGGRQTDSGDCSGPKSARNVLAHPHVEAAVLETARGGMLREGLGFDKCSVAVVTNVGEGDHLGLNHMHTAEDVSRIKQIAVQNVSPSGYAVLNAADPLVASMAPHCPGKVIFFAQSPTHPVMVTHRARGHRVVYVENADIVLAEGAQHHRMKLSDVPLTMGGTLGFQVENTLAAVGACWALDLPWLDIVAGLKSFNNDIKGAPARFNRMSYRGATVVADYGHNPHAMRALVAAFDAMPAAEGMRRTVVISGAGDRRDEDLRQLTRVLGAAFDNVILYEDACQRGRADGEVIGLLREGLEGAQRASFIEEIRGEFIAIDRGLSLLKPGDQCLVLVDQVQEALQHLAQRVEAG
ncbi:MAG: cyanophycin synthetase [Burkholderiales bacterium]|nr:cyanophycin synthetase [Burkholderiales bacterium]